MEDFEDEIGGFLGVEGTGGAVPLAGEGGPPDSLLKRRKLSEVIAEAGKKKSGGSKVKFDWKKS